MHRSGLILLALLSLPVLTHAQNIGINVDGTAPHPSALLDINGSAITGSKRGLLIPRVTATEMNAIVAPATSLLVFNTTANGFFFFNGTAWTPLSSAAGWGLTGNAGTNPATNFIGTTDGQDLNFRVNNMTGGKLSAFVGAGGGHAWLGSGAGLNTAASTMMNTFIGFAAGNNNTLGSQNTFIGMGAGFANTTGSGNTVLGRAATSNGTTTNATAIGQQAQVNTSNSLVLGSVAGVNNATNTVNVGIGTNAPLDRLHVVGNIRMVDGNQGLGRVLVSDLNGTGIWTDPLVVASNLAWTLTGNAGTNPAINFLGTTDVQPLRFRVNNTFAGQVPSSPTALLSLGLNAGPVSTGTSNTFIGTNAGAANTTGANNTFVGNGAGAANTTLGSNVYVGTEAGNANATGQENVYIGRRAGGLGASGSTNVIIGNAAGISNTASNNVLIGGFAGSANTSGGGNIFLGIQSGQGNTTGGQNTFIGGGAGLTNTTGQGLTLLGNSAMVGSTNLVNAGAIGRSSQVDASNALVLGSVAGVNGATNTVNVGIGVNAPLDRLHVVGNIRMVDGNQAANKVLVSDANGTASWQTLGATTTNGWGLTGNAGTNANTNFLGTTDGQPLVLRTNNLERVRVQGTGKVDIGLGGLPFLNLSPLTSGMLQVASTGNIGQVNINTSANSANQSLVLAKTRGTLAAFADVLTNDVLGEVDFYGYRSSMQPGASITSVVESTTPGSFAGDLRFGTAQSAELVASTKMLINSVGNVGIGTLTPQSAVHISRGASGGTSSADAKLVVEDNADNFQHFLAPSGFQSGLLFGTELGSIRAGIVFNPGLITDGLDFRTGGNTVRAVLTNTGDLGVGTTTPDRHAEVEGTGAQFLRISSTSGASGVAGIEFRRSGLTASDWQVRNDGGLLLFGQSADELVTTTDVLRLGGGSVTPASDNTISCGQAALRWTSVFAVNGTINTSDAREKTAVRDLDHGLNAVMRLRPVRFQWKDRPDEGEKLGLIAQEVQQVLPETVVDAEWRVKQDGTRERVPTERLGVYYSDLIPVLVNAIQEQEQRIQELQRQLQELRDRQ